MPEQIITLLAKLNGRFKNGIDDGSRTTKFRDDFIYEDLVFSLERGSEEYARPVVRPKRGDLLVIAHMPFLLALEDAGRKRALVDVVLPEKIDSKFLLSLINAYGFEYPEIHEDKGYEDVFIFFNKTPNLPRYFYEGIVPNPNNNLRSYRKMNCLSFRLRGPADERPNKHMFASELNQYSRVRSLNGLKLT